MSKSIFKALRIPLDLVSWSVFALTLALYWITSDPAVSYWDCPEYVIAASRLEIGHPPGNPVWMLAMRVATIPFPAEYHARVINLCSGLFMAFSVFFLCRVLFVVARTSLPRLFNGLGKKLSGKIMTLIASCVSAGGALCFAFCDSVWFSAVEAEVYAMSTMLSALSLWIMTLWWWAPDKARRWRLLILLSYLIGLSLGVHQLNLLCIPVYGLIILYRFNRERINIGITLFVIMVSLGVVGIILLIVMPGSLAILRSFELFMVNGFGAPYDSGIILAIVLLALLVIISIYLSQTAGKPGLSASFWMLGFVLLGYSSFGIIMIRSRAIPFMNEGSPSDIFALSAYINRDQYPSVPLLYGETPYSSPVLKENIKDGKPVYTRYLLKKGKPLYTPLEENPKLSPRSGFLTAADSSSNSSIISRGADGYLLRDYTYSQVLTPELDMWFPRITSRNPSDRSSYADWAGMTPATMETEKVSDVMDSDGNFSNKANEAGEREEAYSLRPTYAQNLRYFLSYQLFYMYFRYLFWNFMGRQNDYPSTGEIDHGNFITGFPLIDKAMLGPSSTVPRELGKDNPGHNNYYCIPFILGIIGFIWLAAVSRFSRRMLSVSALLFLMTGVAIVVYLNQTPGEPRERDYSFLVSYMAFAIWISAGILFLFRVLLRYLPMKAGILVAILISFFPATLMAVVNFDDHDRRGRFEPLFYAGSLLEMETPSVIFTHGDNSTFPVWYASEIEGLGESHIPVDVTYMGTPDYIINLSKGRDKNLSVMAREGDLRYGAFLLTRIPASDASSPLPLKEALTELYATQDFSKGGAEFPASHVMIVSAGDSLTLNLRDFTAGSSYLSMRHLMLLDILASQDESVSPKALFFPTHIDWNLYRPLKPLLKPALFGKIYSPQLTDSAAIALLERSVKRELSRMHPVTFIGHYADPVTADFTRRHRGEMIMAADILLEAGNAELTSEIIDEIEKKYPYSILSPGSFTVEDSTYYEGKEYALLLDKMSRLPGYEKYREPASAQNKLLDHRRQEWLRYYRSLPADRRSTLSPRSKRILR